MEEGLIEKLDRIGLALAVDGVAPSRSDTARRLLHFGAFMIQHRSPHVTALLKAYEDELAAGI